MNVAHIVEALLFASETPLKPEQILELWQDESYAGMELDAQRLDQVFAFLEEKYADPAFVFELRQIDGGYQLYTKREYYPYLRPAAVMRNQKKLSRASLETLSIIAYRQPITKTEVEFVRGVNCDYAVRKLLDQNLVEIVGRSEAPGRPLLYGTSRYFMEYFGLNDLKDLPKLQEVSIDEGAFQEQFRVYVSASDSEDPVDGAAESESES